MAYLAVDADGSELIFRSSPIRVGDSDNLLKLKKEYHSFFDYDKKQLNISDERIEWKLTGDSIENTTINLKDCNTGKVVTSIVLNKYKDFDHWEDPVYESLDCQGAIPELHHYSDIELPGGSIEKLINKRITWYNEPVEI